MKLHKLIQPILHDYTNKVYLYIYIYIYIYIPRVAFRRKRTMKIMGANFEKKMFHPIHTLFTCSLPGSYNVYKVEGTML